MNENIRAMRSRNATTCRFGPTCPSNEMEPRLRRVLLQGRASRNAVRSQLARATSHHPVHAPSPVTANSSATSGRFRGLNKPKTSQLTGVSPGRRSRRQTTSAENRPVIQGPWRNRPQFPRSHPEVAKTHPQANPPPPSEPTPPQPAASQNPAAPSIPLFV